MNVTEWLTRLSAFRSEQGFEAAVELTHLRKRVRRLEKTRDELAAMIAPAYCVFGRFETCGDPFCSEARERRDAILLQGER